MSRFEALSLIVSIGALLLSALSLVVSRRANQRSLEIQSHQSEIDEARYAHELAEAASARIEITTSGDKLYVTNTGAVSALELTLEFDPPQGDRESPVMVNQLDREFPVSELAPGGRVSLHLARSLGSASSQTAHWSWRHPNGDRKSQSGVIHF